MRLLHISRKLPRDTELHFCGAEIVPVEYLQYDFLDRRDRMTKREYTHPDLLKAIEECAPKNARRWCFNGELWGFSPRLFSISRRSAFIEYYSVTRILL